MDAVRVPVSDGANLKSISQLVCAGTLEPQVVVSTKSPKFVPMIAIPSILKGVLPVFVRITVLGRLMVPTL